VGILGWHLSEHGTEVVFIDAGKPAKASRR